MEQSRKDALMKYRNCPDRERVNTIFAKLDRYNYFDDEWVERSKQYNNLNWRKNIVGINKTIDMLGLKGSQNLKIVDAGAGTGKISLAIAEYADRENINVDIYSVDQSYAMLEKCPEHKKIRKYVADIEHMTFIPNNSIDRIVCSMVLHSEFERVSNIIKEFFRILKKGGILLIFESVPVDDSLVDFYTSFLTIKEKRIMFTKHELSGLMKNFDNVIVEEVILEQQSIENWLHNSCTEDSSKSKIVDIHKNSPEIVKQKINMVEKDNDVFCDWKFAIAKGTKLVISENEANLKEALFAFKDLMDKHDIEFVLVYGTLLGAYRNKRLLPWDADIDIEIVFKNYEDFVNTDIFGLLRDAYNKGFRNVRWAHEFIVDTQYLKYPEIALLPEEQQWKEFLKIDPNWRQERFTMRWYCTNSSIGLSKDSDEWVHIDCTISIKDIHPTYIWYDEQQLGKIILYGSTFYTPPDILKHFGFYYGPHWEDIFCSDDLWKKYSVSIRDQNGPIPQEIEDFMKKWKPLLEDK